MLYIGNKGEPQMPSNKAISRYFSAMTWTRQNYHGLSDGRNTFLRINKDGVIRRSIVKCILTLYRLLGIQT